MSKYRNTVYCGFKSRFLVIFSSNYRHHLVLKIPFPDNSFPKISKHLTENLHFPSTGKCYGMDCPIVPHPLLVWVLHSRKLNSRVNKLHEIVLRIQCIKIQNYASSFSELLEKDNSTTIHNRNIQLLATELFKAKNGLSPPFMNKIFPENIRLYYDLRKKTECKRNNVKTVYSRIETLTFLGPRILEIVPDYI